MLQIRPEHSDDAQAIRHVHTVAFPSNVEARLVDLLRDNGHLSVSLVAEVDKTVVAHVAFSPVMIETATTQTAGLGLGPVAVLPSHQQSGIGTRLIDEGLQACRQTGLPFVVVLGHPRYYPRFGFERAGRFGIENEYEADDAFMILALQSGRLSATGGLARYGAEFAMVVE